ncbi:Hsp20/alpha crystallin family protein [Mycobacterium sp. KBS0706]|uniref:Hsp20/alpha crystallin family protein n=1 Tax=Mycobacterium sp. KBS0706 TaxID=2578109 RepID=UPI00110F7A36|nr:Hsp20/alpha crystallin family protein [Mycobacterium sp. KBS0706]TSD84649.1 Hsp20/alpha crystallin family protein [Mycobacterium sp. KBS0706]
MSLRRSDPFESLFSLQQALERLRRSDWLETSASAAGAYPPINIFRKNDDFIVLTEVPGMHKSALEIQVKGNTIRIAGTKTLAYPEGVSVHRRERSSGRFDRAVTLPLQIDPDAVKAEYHDGMLALLLPCADREKPRSIAIS